MSDKIKLEFNGNTIALDINKPVPIPGKQEDGSHRFFQVCCCCGLTHAVHLTSETMEFNQIDNTENKKISQALAKRILDAEDKVSAQAAKIEELEKQNNLLQEYPLLCSRCNELEAKLEAEHENFLAVHRDNMELCARNLELKAKLERAREALKAIEHYASQNNYLFFSIEADRFLHEIEEAKL